jgi:uncharacterized surface protein with fasciclin (FAS1) repeats/outer membrane protein OmpA-like peptidoglycan-associated protein
VTTGTTQEFARTLQAKLAEGDLPWLRDRFVAGELNFLRDLIPQSDRVQFPQKLDERDLPWIRSVLSRVTIEGVGPLATTASAVDVGPLGGPPLVASGPFAAPPSGPPLRPGAGPLGPLAGDTPGLGAVAVTEAPPPFELPVTDDRRRGRGRWWWLALPLVLLVALVAFLVARRSDDDDAAPATTATTRVVTSVSRSGTLAATIGGDPRLTTFAAALRQAGLADVLADPASALTVLAPTNDAFAAVPPAQLQALLANEAALKTVLQHHVIAGRLSTATAKAGDVPTLAGGPVAVARTGTTVTFGGASLTAADLTASNGVVHVIDRVLVPKDVDLAALAAGASTTASTTATTTATTTASTTAAPTTASPTSTAPTTSAPTTAAPTTVATTAPPAPPSTTGPGVDVVIKFPQPNGTTLDAAAQAQVADLAPRIAALPAGSVVVVTGWSDTRSGDRTAAEQSRARAQNVVAALQAAGATNVTYDVVVGGSRWAAVYADARRVEIDLP